MTYTTTYSYSNDNYADYGQPNHIAETGDLSRTTDITYRHDFSRYIRGRPASRTVTADGVASTTSYTYDGSTGFLTSQTVLGLTATFTPDSYGNVASVTKPGKQHDDVQLRVGRREEHDDARLYGVPHDQLARHGRDRDARGDDHDLHVRQRRSRDQCEHKHAGSGAGDHDVHRQRRRVDGHDQRAGLGLCDE
jgi:hypothetical protein